MKAKRFFIGLCMLLSINIYTYPQSVSIELSLEWTKGEYPFREDSTIYYPNLIITYRNLSDTSYYFQKVSNGRCGLPVLPRGTLLQHPVEEFLNPDYFKRAMMYGNYASSSFTVLIGGDSYYRKGWIVMDDTLDTSVEQEMDMINDDLVDIYDFIYQKNVKQPETFDDYKFFYAKSDVLPDSILNNQKLKDKFVFLKPGEKYTEAYNLIGFKLLKGSFTFVLLPFIPSYVFTTPVWDEETSKYKNIKVGLPKSVGGYMLYFGSFNTNKTTITF